MLKNKIDYWMDGKGLKTNILQRFAEFLKQPFQRGDKKRLNQIFSIQLLLQKHLILRLMN
ncbi:hypothetical protein AF332_07920 [Sporosarcina globispora]|uniref:Uncharacterized protein n=1 Tax=Sporosarcina globispora TaxID=1459 RepID=A0A0M0GB19_SPOGL|nr:hypothetical protein AF332_07920 [Sporosarcina globispora]